jgi:hypothetical protein
MVRRAAGVLLVGFVVSGCARSAPDLPPDYGSINAATTLSAEQFARDDLQLSCTEIAERQRALIERAESLTGVIRSNRQHNQAAGYFGGLFLLPLVAVRNNDDEKRQLDTMQARWDTLESLERFKSCPTSSR